MIEHGIEHHFIKPDSRELYFVTESVEDAVEYLGRHDKP
jgi:predicted Rossmann-fold nucleotide-binding protein